MSRAERSWSKAPMIIYIIKMLSKNVQTGQNNNTNNKTIPNIQKSWSLVAQIASKRALVKSQRKVPAPQWEDASNRLLKPRALVNPKGKHLRQSRKK